MWGKLLEGIKYGTRKTKSRCRMNLHLVYLIPIMFVFLISRLFNCLLLCLGKILKLGSHGFPHSLRRLIAPGTWLMLGTPILRHFMLVIGLTDFSTCHGIYFLSLQLMHCTSLKKGRITFEFQRICFEFERSNTQRYRSALQTFHLT